MKTAQVVKAALVLAILVSLFKMIVRPAGLLRRWGGGGRWGGRGGGSGSVQPYALERFDDYEAEEEYEAEQAEEDYEGAEEDYEADEDMEESAEQPASMMNDVIQGMTAEDYEAEDYDDGEEAEDYDDGEEAEEYDDGEEYEGEAYEQNANTVETFTNTAAPSDWTGTKGLMNVATDLLPKPTYKDQDFAEFAPKALLGQNFLETKKYIGVDTKGSSLRNANYDLRSTPSIPRQNVGPWAQSTIDADLFRKPLE